MTTTTHARRRRAVLTALVALSASIGLVGSAQAAGAAPTARGAALAPAAVDSPADDLGWADTPLEAPPAPAAAQAEALPLANDNAAEVDIAAPAPVQAAPRIRDLGANPPAVPGRAVTYSNQDAGPASTLVLYDTTGDWSKLGEYYAMAMGNLASHSGLVTALPVADYQAGLAGRYTNVIYTGSTYDEPLPRAFIDDVLTGDVPVLWSGFNIWQLVKTDADRAAFTARFGWDAATSYIDATDRVTQVEYNGQVFGRNELNKGGITAPHITDQGAVTVLGKALCSSADGAAAQCASIAQSGTTSFPWAVSSGGLTFIGEVPVTYMSEQDRYIAAADIVLDSLQPGAEQIRQAAVRIEDVGPDTDPAELQAMVDYLFSQGVPFQMAVFPEYEDPSGAKNDGTPQSMTLKDTPELVAVLKDAVSKGGTIVQHGTTHQFGDLNNPYNGVSSDDFEFIRSWCSDENYPDAPVAPCQQNSWVQIGGELPGTSAKWAKKRVKDGRKYFKKLGLPTPKIFETPHYSASRSGYEGINKVYSTRYERELMYAGTLTGTPGGPHDYIGQFFPYSVNDPYGTHVLPENLGNYEPKDINNHPPRSAQQVIDSARLNLAGTHATASFFFHPYYPLNELKTIVEGIKSQGYTFVAAQDLR